MFSLKKDGKPFACEMISINEACNRFANGKMRNDCMPHLWKSFLMLYYMS